MRSFAFILIAAFAATSWAWGIDPAKDNYVAASFVRPAAKELIVLVPVFSADPFLAKGDAIVLAQLKAQLTAAGYQVGELPRVEYDKAVEAEIEASNAITGSSSARVTMLLHARALSKLAQGACSASQCASLLIHCRLANRVAPVDSINAEWDGQRRGVIVMDPRPGRLSLRGEMDALSVELLGFSAKGALAFKSYGGASVLFARNAKTLAYAPRPDLFDNDSEVAQGVALAIAVFLP